MYFHLWGGIFYVGRLGQNPATGRENISKRAEHENTEISKNDAKPCSIMMKFGMGVVFFVNKLCLKNCDDAPNILANIPIFILLSLVR